VRLHAVLLQLAVVSSLFVSTAHGQEPGRMGVVIARGELRQQIKATPIQDRPNRPLHFYGNTVRRAYQRGAARPSPGEPSRDAETATARP
jgi:hypothetical protein